MDSVAKRTWNVVLAVVTVSVAALCQSDFSGVHQDDFRRWSQVTTLAEREIHQMWRSVSHYADEKDDDSSIELVDGNSLSSRRQILLITSAGIPKCLSVAVFSAAVTHRRLWHEEQGPDGRGFCDNLGVPAETVTTFTRQPYRGSGCSPASKHIRL
jgi:hypothetical protein